MRSARHPTVLSQEEEAREVVKKYFDRQGSRPEYSGPDFIDAFIKRNELYVKMVSNIKSLKTSVTKASCILVD